MSAKASQIPGVLIVCSPVGSGTDQRKPQSSAPLVVVRGINRWPVNSPYRGPVRRTKFPFDDVIMIENRLKSELWIWIELHLLITFSIRFPASYSTYECYKWILMEHVIQRHNRCTRYLFVFHVLLTLHCLLRNILWSKVSDEFNITWRNTQHGLEITCSPTSGIKIISQVSTYSAQNIPILHVLFRITH